MAYSKRLASELLRRRIAAGLSQDEVRQKSGLGSQNLISMLERNVTDKPSMEDLVKLGKVFHMTPNDVAEVAGWWSPDKQPEIPPALQEVLRDTMALSGYTRNQVIEMFRKLVMAFQVSQRQDDAVSAAEPAQR